MKAIKVMFVLFVLLYTNTIFCQTITFKKVYPDFAGHNDIVCKPLNNDKSFLLSGFGNGLTLFKISSTGNLILHKASLPLSRYCNIFFDDESSFTLYSHKNNNKVMFKLDTSLNIISAIQYDSINLWQAAIDRNILCSTFKKGFVLSGGRGILTPLIVKTDSSGNILWSKYFTPIQGGIEDIIQTKDSGFVIAANLKNNLGASLIKTDSSGNVLWSKSYFRPRGYIHSVLENTDGTIMMTGSTDSINGIYDYLHTSSLFYIKLDNAGNVLWAKSFGDSINSLRQYPSQIKLTSDSGYMVLATLAKTDLNDDLILIKLDKNGDTLWCRAHGSSSSSEYGQSVEQLNDEGYIISGISNNNIPVPLSSLYFIRTDSLGHTDSLCEEYSVPIAINNIIVNDSTLSVASVSFNVSTSVPDSNTQNHTYYSYDGCHLDEVPELIAEQAATLVIYPNPSDGRFTVEIKTSKPIKTTIEIYSINRQRIYSAVINENVADIDLTGHSPGLYFIRMSNARFVKTGKMMME